MAEWSVAISARSVNWSRPYNSSMVACDVTEVPLGELLPWQARMQTLPCRRNSPLYPWVLRGSMSILGGDLGRLP